LLFKDKLYIFLNVPTHWALFWALFSQNHLVNLRRKLAVTEKDVIFKINPFADILVFGTLCQNSCSAHLIKSLVTVF
jgi:hypothetical protein